MSSQSSLNRVFAQSSHPAYADRIASLILRRLCDQSASQKIDLAEIICAIPNGYDTRSPSLLRAQMMGSFPFELIDEAAKFHNVSPEELLKPVLLQLDKVDGLVSQGKNDKDFNMADNIRAVVRLVKSGRGFMFAEYNR